MLAQTRNEEFELFRGLYSVSDIQDCFEYILKNMRKRLIILQLTLKLLTPETMKLLGSNESKITKDKNRENIPNLEITEVVLVHCNIVNND